MSQLYRFCFPDMSELTKKGIQPQGLNNESFIANEIFYVKGPARHYAESFTSILIDGSFNYSLIQQKILCVNSLHENNIEMCWFSPQCSIVKK